MSIDRVGVVSLVGVGNVSVQPAPDKRETKEKLPVAPVSESATSAASGSTTRLRIEFSRETGRFVYQSIEPVTGKVLDQIPKEEIIRRLTFLREQGAQKVDQSA